MTLPRRLALLLLGPLLLAPLLLAPVWGTALAVELPVSAPPGEAEAAARPDRSRPPEVQPPARLVLPPLRSASPHPGLGLHHLALPGVYKVELRVSFNMGSLELCPEDRAACEVLDAHLGLASERFTPAELEAELDRLNASLSGGVGMRSTTFVLTLPGEHLEEGVALLDDALRRPEFPRGELRRSARTEASWITLEAPSDLGAVAGYAVEHAWYAEGSEFALRPEPEAWRRVRPRQLKALQARLLEEASVEVLLVGPSDDALADRLMAGLSEGLGVPHERVDLPAPMDLTEDRVLAVDMRGYAQASLALRTAAPPRHHPEELRFEALNYALGGPFNSRVNRNLREDKGWTYGAGSWFSAMDNHGVWELSVELPVAHVGAAVGEIEAELDGLLRLGATGAELNAGWREEVTWWNDALQTAHSAASRYAPGLLDPRDSVPIAAAKVDALGELSPARLVSTGERWLGPESPKLWVVVGDRAALEPQLEALGWAVTWISPEEAVRGRW